MAEKTVVKVLIDGKIITLTGYESEEYLHNVAYYLNNKIMELKGLPGYNRLTPDTKANLLALNIADDYFKAKEQVDAMEADIEEKDRDTYDARHELIAAKVQIEKLNKEIAQLKNRRDR